MLPSNISLFGEFFCASLNCLTIASSKSFSKLFKTTTPSSSDKGLFLGAMSSCLTSSKYFWSSANCFLSIALPSCDFLKFFIYLNVLIVASTPPPIRPPSKAFFILAS